MTDPSPLRLLAFARELQRATTFPELLETTRTELAEAVGYHHVWMFLAVDETVDEVRLLDISSASHHELAWKHAPTLRVRGDRMLEEIVASDLPIVVADARTDPRTDKQMVAKFDNRTIVNVPLRLVDKPMGMLGCGTFGDEGVREPTRTELDHLVAVAGQVTVAASRIQLNEIRQQAELERRELERRAHQIQRLESLGLLAGGVAHDFNNLLTIILSGAALVRQRCTDPEAHDDVDVIVDAATRGAELTRHLLTISKARALKLEEVSLDGRIQAMLAILRRLLPESIGIEHIPRSASALVDGDPSELDQVLMNLCINARDAMPTGGRLTIESEVVLVNGRYAQTHPWAKPGRYVLVTVTDTGCGMPEAVCDRVFEPFFTTKGEAGSGLGLATAYGIVRRHGGMLHCYSEVGVGTSFKVYLPLSARPAAEVGTKLAPRARGGSERILVAEDHKAIRDVIRRVLEQAGYVVELVGDGGAACAAFERFAPDLVLLDVVMPGQPCAETIRQLRAMCPGIRLLLSSGYTADTHIGEIVRDSGVELLQKPFDPDELLRALRKALET